MESGTQEIVVYTWLGIVMQTRLEVLMAERVL